MSKKIRTILYVSLIANILFFSFAYLAADVHELDFVRLTGDTKSYLLLSDNLLKHHVFSVSRVAPYVPESFRSPGYPAFLAGIYFFVPDWFFVALVHMVLMAVLPVLLYLLVVPYNEKAAWWSALLFAVEPTKLFLSTSLLSDALFTGIFLSILLLVRRACEKKSYVLMGSAGLLLGIGILVRPIAIFLPFVFLLYGVWTVRPLRQALMLGMGCIIGAVLVVLPWSWRNHEHFGSWGVSSVGAANLMLYNAPVFAAHLQDEKVTAQVETFRATQDSLSRDEALSLARTPVFTDTFREVIRGHELSYIGFHLAKTLPFFVTDGLREIERLLGFPSAPSFNITGAMLHGNIGALLSYLRQGGFSIALLIVGSGFWTLVTLLFFLSVFASRIERKHFPFMALLCATVLYFAVLTGPVSNARYRLPVSGVMIAGAALLLVRNTSTGREAASHKRT